MNFDISSCTNACGFVCKLWFQSLFVFPPHHRDWETLSKKCCFLIKGKTKWTDFSSLSPNKLRAPGSFLLQFLLFSPPQMPPQPRPPGSRFEIPLRVSDLHCSWHRGVNVINSDVQQKHGTLVRSLVSIKSGNERPQKQRDSLSFIF